MAIIITLPLTLNFSVNANINFVYDWKYDCCTKDALKLIDERFHGQRVSIMYTMWYEPGLRYYKHLWKMDKLIMAGENRINTDEDVLLVMSQEKDVLKNLNEYDSIKYFKEADFFLFFKKICPIL